MLSSRTLVVLAAAILSTPALALAGPAPVARLEPALEAVLAEDPAGPVPVIVRFTDAPTASDVALLRNAGFLPPFVRYDVVPAIATEGPASAVRAVASEPRVAYVSHDAVLPYTLDRAATVTRASAVWDATYQDVDGVHAGGLTGRGVRVAVVDSGIDATHPDLLWAPLAVPEAGLHAKTVKNFKVVGRSIANLVVQTDADGTIAANTLGIDVADSDTTGGHGTHVAGSVAGNGFASGGRFKGAAPGADLVGYGAGEALVISTGLAAFDHIHLHHAELGVRVVTNSWGGAGDWDPESPVTIAARKLVNEDGLVVLFAAGNDGGDGASIQTSVWANIPEVLSVANYYDRSGWLHDTSSRGKRDLERTWPDVAAPGTQIVSTAAFHGPVTYVCTGQDAALNQEILGGDRSEPNVVPAPLPAPVEADASGQHLLVGWYASCSGTSMATPFVAGVVALMLEANPALTPDDVKALLRETANMPEGRSYATDGYAVGKGVVDAGEAVAAALRMKAGASVAEALATAYVDYAASPAEIDLEYPARLVLKSPDEGATVTGPNVTVSGRVLPGPSPDDSIPLTPAAPPPVAGTMTVFHDVAGAALNPCALTLEACAVGGETVDLRVRTIVANRAGVDIADGDFDVQHSVYRDGVLAYGPFDAAITPDGTAWQSSADWTAPVDAPAGAYEFAASFREGADAYEEFGRISITVVAPGVAPATASSSSVALAEDFEGGGDGWTTTQDSQVGPGLLTEWNFLDENTQLSWAGSHSGTDYYWAGLFPGANTAAGLLYTDLADVSLVSPPIDLTDASSATLSYWRAGFSERDFDFLTVLVDDGATLTEVDRISGDLLNGGDASGSWEESVVSLDASIGKVVRLRFRFTSDETTFGANLAGWSVDDVTVTKVQGGGTPTVNAVLSASRDAGVGSLATTFDFSASGNVPITGYALDFGDGSPVHVATEAGSVAHTYAPGQYTATLRADGVGASDEATVTIDVAPVGVVQARIADRPWVDAETSDGHGNGVSDKGTPFRAVLDASGLAGPQTIEVRLFDASGHRMYATVDVDVV